MLDDKITWDDFSLTFRMRLNREPDIYHTVVQGFLRLEPEDMNWFCERLLTSRRTRSGSSSRPTGRATRSTATARIRAAT